ncbi:MAG: DUF1080 domain-containing protein [Planctomycetota bacterium]
MRTRFPQRCCCLIATAMIAGFSLLTDSATAQQNNLISKSGITGGTDQPLISENSGNTTEEWIQLFNGKDLTGWTPKIVGHQLGDNYGDTFRVVDGNLTVSYDQYKPEDLLSQDGSQKPLFDKFGHLFYKDTFSHYILRVEYRFIGDQIANGPGWAFRNNGLMIHGQDPARMEIDQKFPISIEVQLLGGENNRTTLNLCTPGTNVVMNGNLFQPHCVSSKSEKYPGDQWVTCEIEVRGSKMIRHKIDGNVVLEYTEPQYDARDAKKKKCSYSGDPQLMRDLIKDGNLLISEGTISIQSESHPTQFRKIEIKQLDPNS